MTPDAERWAEALAVQRVHGPNATRFVEERLAALSSAGDTAGVERWKVISAKLEQLMAAQAISH